MDDDEMLQLAGEFAVLAAEIHGDGSNEAALHRLVELPVKHVPGCAWASVTVLRGQHGTTIAASDDVARLADRLQYEAGQGPCLSAAADGRTFTVFDVDAEHRWPSFTGALVEQTPVRSVLSFQLASTDSAALNLFGNDAGAFGDESVVTGTIFAAHISTAIALYEAEDRADHLQRALEHSREIRAAIGVLMAHHKVTREAAFELLRTASQKMNRKLREVASDVVQTGALPTSTTMSRRPNDDAIEYGSSAPRRT